MLKKKWMVNDMLCSMTGFGRSEVSVGERKVTVEIKSVNHRFLEAGIKLPKKLNYLDGDIRRILKSKIERGKVDVFIILWKHRWSKCLLEV